jgi:CBS domain-containing protein
MSRDVRIASPTDTIANAARTMMEIDAGSIPVGENDRLVGMITDRDIAVRAVAQNKGSETIIRDVMSPNIVYCFENDNVEDAAKKMGDQQVRRLPVLDENKRLVGILSLGDIAQKADDAIEASGEALRDVARPGGQHTQ